ncbi:hypothetical protein HYDPIDRAFT_105463 [Hydnomerulius pinastri MD-312]|nr:hypothetical protein HYDPIDRAFT_105463 [Hydnomerulius pinastri MD-312]
MEVDMQSPSFRTARSMGYTTKRSRSPGSPSQERQAKRLSLAIGEGHFARRSPSVVSDAMASDCHLPKQDDWVRQARELTIESPLTVGYPPVVDGGATQSRSDEHMAIDHEDTLRPHSQLSMSRFLQSRSHLPSIHITTTSNSLHALSPQPSAAPFSVLTASPSSMTEVPSPSSSIPAMDTNAHAPAIFLFPATPSDTPSPQHNFGSDIDHANSQARIEGVSKTEAPTSSGKKHRVTMGPRADCIKCKMGVKGHWMHFD